MKTYKRRDSATSVLRKLGIKPRDYDLFIKPVEGGIEFDDELAKQHAAKLKVQTDETKPKKSPAKKAKPQAAKSKGKTQLQVATDLILEGKSNQEIWEVIQPMFNLDEKKRHYPSWYRCHLRRIGVLEQSTRVTRRAVEVLYE